MGLIEALGGRSTYFDANVFIYAVEDIAPYAEPLRLLMDEVKSGHVAATTSELTLAEVLVHPFRDGDLARERSFTRAIRTRDGLSVVPVSRAVLIEAARLRATTATLKLPDAVHAASARLHGCRVLLTNDARLRDAPGVEVVQLSDVV